MSQKHVPPSACYNFDTHERILIFFGRNATNKVRSQKTLYYATSSNLCFCTTRQSGKQKLHFSLAVLLHCQNSSSRCLTSSVWLTTHTLLYDSLNLVINAFSLGFCGAWFRRKEVESAATVGLCCTHKAPVRCLLGFLFCKLMLKY